MLTEAAQLVNLIHLFKTKVFKNNLTSILNSKNLMMLFYFNARCNIIWFLTESKALEILFADSQPVQTSPLANSKLIIYV